MRCTALLVILLLVAARAVDARWQGPQDSKSFSELRSMAPDELFNESFDVCIRRAMLEKSGATDPESSAEVTVASEYLEVLEVAAAAQHGGAAPAWMAQLTAAHSVKDCQRAFHTYLQGTAPAAAGTPAARRQVARPEAPVAVRPAVKTPRPHVSGATEELPPWLAPPKSP